MSIIQEISCAHCGAPILFKPGEIVTTCRYCGFTQVIETGKPFTFKHSMFLNKYDEAQVETVVRKWMRTGFTKPSDLAKRSKITEKNLVYIPFWVLEVEASSTYKGIFERLTPPAVKEGKIEKHYDWLVLARKATQFPTREYDVPLEGKVPYDFRKIEGFAKVLNSEIEKSEALEKAKQQVEAHNQFLAKQEVDKIIEMHTDLKLGDIVYLHAPIWFVTYEYKKESCKIILDGATGMVIKGDIPTINFSLI
ncbi:MAG: hypothetical protein OEY24_07785 [Candidatus Bathyarchaeota archaeon]|nr:hypothetical protein [Candidatus Bathyarchaeota archaeon]MDH5495581.1 hypothetical protein [Candidatus Bathyarchaeota archaeon]